MNSDLYHTRKSLGIFRQYGSYGLAIIYSSSRAVIEQPSYLTPIIEIHARTFNV